MFVSPSVKSNLDLKGAEKELTSRQQVRLRAASADIWNRVGVGNVHEVNAIGAWKDGAENTLMSRSDSDWNKNKLAAVMKGYIADQKAVIVFQQNDASGKSSLTQFEAKGKLAKIAKNLADDGIEFYTLVPKEGGATVYMVDFNGDMLDKMHGAARRYGDDNKLYYQFGDAEYIGNSDESGSDREQRDRAREIYQGVIDQSPVAEAKSIWKDVRDHWLPSYEAEGYDLTPTAIIAENPNIKKGSVRKEEAAKMLNARAGEILQRDLGMKYIDEDNHTPETDEYLANVIMMELRE